MVPSRRRRHRPQPRHPGKAHSGPAFLQTYTRSKTTFRSFACCGAQRPSNPYDGRRDERGLAETDQRHRATRLFRERAVLSWFT